MISVLTSGSCLAKTSVCSTPASLHPFTVRPSGEKVEVEVVFFPPAKNSKVTVRPSFFVAVIVIAMGVVKVTASPTLKL